MNNIFADLINRDKTAALVNDHNEIRCDCDDCRSYYSYADDPPENVKIFFDDLGIDLTKIRELEIMNERGSCALNNGKKYYSGYFPVSAAENKNIPEDLCDDFGEFIIDGDTFRLRFETLTDGRTVIGFECDLEQTRNIT